MMLKMKPYQVQLDRAKRSLNRIEKRLEDYTKGNVSEDPAFFMDIIFNFFCECHIIKDFIKNDKSIITNKNPVKHIEENECLKISADICNQKKHLELNKSWTKKDYKINLQGKAKEKVTEFKINIVSDSGEEWEFFTLAQKCIQSWELFIKNHIK
jgi:hypothetical protein